MKYFLLAAALITSGYAELCLKGIRLVGAPSQLNEWVEKEGMVEIDVCLPGSEKVLCKKLSQYLGQALDEELLNCIKREITSFYRSHDRPIVAVIVPKNREESPFLHLIVVEGRLGEISVQRNCHFPDCRLKNYLGLCEGGPISLNSINKGMILINRNPFRQADVVYKPGSEAGKTDIDLIVQDRRPYRFYGGFDNTGNSVTGNNRIFAGFNWGDVFHSDQMLSFQFSASDDFKSFLGYVGRYTIPLPIRHILSFYGGYSTVDAKFEAEEEEIVPFRNHGYNAQASMRYDIPFSPLYNFLQECSTGIDFKRMNNNLEFGGVPVFSKNVNLFQLMLSYNVGYEAKTWLTTFEAEVFASPMDWLPNQSNAVYQTLRPFAKSRYAYGRGSFSLTHYFSQWFQYNLFLRGQLASANLLPSEEYGIGGYDTVRGYQEREANGDDALNINFEFATAPFQIIRRFCKDQMQLLAFFDYGSAYIHTTASGEKRGAYLYSVGPGLRYQLGTYISARLDWGFQLHHITPHTPHQRLHFQFIGSF